MNYFGFGISLFIVPDDLDISTNCEIVDRELASDTMGNNFTK